MLNKKVYDKESKTIIGVDEKTLKPTGEVRDYCSTQCFIKDTKNLNGAYRTVEPSQSNAPCIGCHTDEKQEAA